MSRDAQRSADDTLRQEDRVPAVGRMRASDERIHLSAAEADALIKREATQHTPGPWEHVTADRRVMMAGDIRARMPNGTLFVLAEVRGTGPEAVANGNAMAAAPDMLAALEAAFVALGRNGGNMLNGPYRAEWEAARAAIAKATGGAA